MSRSLKTSGFAGIEILVALLVLIAIGLAGYVMLSHSHAAKTIPPPDGWLIYKSEHSLIQFNYPKTWQLNQVSLKGKPSYYLEDELLTGPNDFSLEFVLEKTHTPPKQFWSCPRPPTQRALPINSRYNMVVTDRDSVSLLATDTKGSTSDDFACGSLINVLGTDKLFKFSGGYTTTGTTQTQSIETLASQPEVQTTKTIFSSLIQ